MTEIAKLEAEVQHWTELEKIIEEWIKELEQ